MKRPGIKLPGLLFDKMPSGNYRCRVRVEGHRDRKIVLHVMPEDPDFMEHYHAARLGKSLNGDTLFTPRPVKESLNWLIGLHLDDMERHVKAGTVAKGTFIERRSLLKQFAAMPVEDGDTRGDWEFDIPTTDLVRVHSELAATPTKADNTIKALKALYKWAIKMGYATSNPAMGVERYNINKGGATAWKPADFKKYLEIHKPGTQAHLCLTLFAFTACRISDAYQMGRQHEKTIDGVRHLAWQPQKKGSAFVTIPMMPQLEEAIAAQKVVGTTYLMTAHGRPFSSAEGLRNRFKKWCEEAGLGHLSSHGIRKGAGEYLAENGATQYGIMTVHGHTEAQTSEVYTKNVQRRSLARETMEIMRDIEW